MSIQAHSIHIHIDKHSTSIANNINISVITIIFLLFISIIYPSQTNASSNEISEAQVTTQASSEDSATSTDSTTSSNNLTGSVQAGALISTGDDEEYTENGEFKVKYLRDKWTYTSTLSALYSYDSTNDDTDERYQVQGQAQYSFSERNYRFVSTNYLTDSSDDYDYIWDNQVGYGRRILNDEAKHMTLDIQFGPGYRIAPSDEEDIQDQQITANGSLNYDWNISEATTLNENIGISYANIDTITTIKTSITTNIYKQLGIQLSSTITHHTDPAGGSEKTNTYNTLNLIYGF